MCSRKGKLIFLSLSFLTRMFYVRNMEGGGRGGGEILESGEKKDPCYDFISAPVHICAHGHLKKLKKLSLLSRTPFFSLGRFRN